MSQDSSQQPTEHVSLGKSSDQPEGKGRPTPSRKEAEAARKEALKLNTKTRAGRKAAREKLRKERLYAREQMLAGNPQYLPARDAGPARAMTRDFVDGRRSAGELFVPVAFIVLILGLVPNKAVQTAVLAGWTGMLLFVVLDTFIIGIRLKAKLKAELPANTSTRGCIAYGVMRALQLRKLRIPKPRVTPGKSANSV